METKKIIEFVTKNPWLATVITGTIIPGIFAAATATFEMYRAYTTGSEWGKSSYALEQKKLWEINFSCMQDKKFNYIKNNYNVKIGTLICESGDVLISAQKPDAKFPSYKWVSWNKITTDIALNVFVSSAHAAHIINSYYTNEGYLVQEIVDENGTCIRYFINPYNGFVIHSEYC